MPDNSIFILALALLSIALVAGMTVLTLALSNGRALNRQLALVLLAFMMINGLEVTIRLQSGAGYSGEVRSLIAKGVDVLALCGAWIIFRFVQTLVGVRDWTSTISRLFAGIGVVLGVLIIIILPGNAAKLLTYGLIVYVLCVLAATATLMWQARRQRISPFFNVGIGLLLVSVIPVVLPSSQQFWLSAWFGAAASILLAIGIVRLGGLNAFESERSQLAIARAAGVSLTTRLEMADLLDLIARQAAGLVGSPGCEIYLAEAETLIYAASYGFPPEVKQTPSFPFGAGLAGQAASTRRVVNVPDYAQWPGRLPMAQAIAPVHSAAAIPLIFADEVVGVLNVVEFGTERIYTDEDMAVLELLAPQAAIAIVNARAYAQVAQREQHLAEERDRLLRVHEAVGQMLATPEPLDRLQVAADAIRGLGWNCVRISLFDPSLNVLKQVIAGRSWNDNAHKLSWEDRLTQATESQRLGVAYYMRDRNNPDHRAQWSKQDSLFIPLRLSDQRVAGVIELSEPVDGLAPSEEELRPLGIMSAQAAATLENSRLLDDLQAAKDALTDQVEELMMLQSVDQELNATLNLDSVMMLATDWALRRTGARAAMFAITTTDGTGLVPLVHLGYPAKAMSYSEDHPLPISKGIIGRTVRTRQISLVRDVTQDPDYMAFAPGMHVQIVVPMEMQGRVLGVISLESDRNTTFSDSDVEFIQRLAARAAVALDNARLYREAERRADEMSTLYSAGRAISSSLEREEILPVIAQSIAAMLNMSSSVIADCRVDRMQAVVLTTYRLGTAQNASEDLPAIGETWNLNSMPAFGEAIRTHRTLALRRADLNAVTWEASYMDVQGIKAMLLTPLVVQNEVLGIAMAFESRRDRAFTFDETLLFESLASQAAVAFRQAKLYDEVRELENLKSEMIRMASHDLRNPLGNVMGYLEVLVMQLGGTLGTEQMEFVTNIRRSAASMKSLIDDLLTLEKVESERQSSWVQLDFSQLVQDTYEVQLASAALKQQTLLLERDPDTLMVFGSSTQLRQAVSNLINNAIKYTPEEGQIIVRLRQINEQLRFEVEDNGYGIAPERQARLFQRFYRAKQPGTDHIPGTGLGLSLVKTVINRHGGEVWVKSVVGSGSTFGFWLPDAETTLMAMIAQPGSKGN